MGILTPSVQSKWITFCTEVVKQDFMYLNPGEPGWNFTWTLERFVFLANHRGYCNLQQINLNKVLL